MSRESILARYRDLDAQAAEVDGLAPSVLPEAAVPTEVHRQVLALLDELLDLMPADAGPAALLLRTLRRAEPMLLADFAQVPPEALVSFLHGLGDRFHAIGTDGPRLDQSQSA
jgi:hypothetical protein